MNNVFENSQSFNNIVCHSAVHSVWVLCVALCLFLQDGCMSFYNLTRKFILYCIFCIFVIHSTSYCHFDWILDPKTVWHVYIYVCMYVKFNANIC